VRCYVSQSDTTEQNCSARKQLPKLAAAFPIFSECRKKRMPHTATPGGVGFFAVGPHWRLGCATRRFHRETLCRKSRGHRWTKAKSGAFAPLLTVIARQRVLSSAANRDGLVTAHHLHQFGLRLEPVVVSVFVGSVAGLVDLVSANSYLFLRESAHLVLRVRFLWRRLNSFLTYLDDRF